MNEKGKLAKKGLAKMRKCGKMRSDLRGYSLMVKLQPSKLIMRVRFPLPALFPGSRQGERRETEGSSSRAERPADL